jgi:hypothetical protein
VTENEARRIVAYVAAAWPGPPWAETSMRIWVNEILDLPADAGQEGARMMVRETQKFPSVAELRHHAFSFMRRQEGERGRQILLDDRSEQSAEEQAEIEDAVTAILATLKRGLAAKGLEPFRRAPQRARRGDSR